MGISYYIANIKDINAKNAFLDANKKNKDIKIENDSFLLYRAVGHKPLLIDDIEYAYSANSLTDLIFAYTCVFDVEDIDNAEDNEDDSEEGDELLIRDLVSNRLNKINELVILKRINNKYSIVLPETVLKNKLYQELLNDSYTIEDLVIYDDNYDEYEEEFSAYRKIAADFKDINYHKKFDDVIIKCLSKFKEAILTFDNGDVWQVIKSTRGKLKYGVTKEDNKMFPEVLKEQFLHQTGMIVRVLVSEDVESDLYMELYGFIMSYNVEEETSVMFNLPYKNLYDILSTNQENGVNRKLNPNDIYCDLEGNRYMV